MEKFALGTTVFALACGLAFAQADAPQTTKPAAQPAVTTPSSGASTTTAPSSAATTMVAVRSWKGTLMDAGCASGGGASSPAAESGNPEAKETKSADSDSPDAKAAKPHKNQRNRVDPQAQACAVSNSTTAFALKTKEGQVLKFDAVGNNRAAEVLKTKWGQTLSAGKPIHAKVSGIANADTVSVTSVD
jgi:hypothetical protein